MPAINADSITRFCSRLTATVKSTVKILLSGRPGKFPAADPSRPLLILGNGPSLRSNIDNDSEMLAGNPTLAVNFAANSPEFTGLKPDYYVLADPHFFMNPDDPNVARLIDNLSAVTWPMTLFVPAGVRVPDRLRENGKLSIATFCFTAAEGFGWFERLAFNSRRGMPRPRNVLIPSIMIGFWMGYRQIFLLGADHSWTRTLAVDNDNNVVSIQPHFYQEDTREQQRIKKAYLKLPLHQVLDSFRIAFQSYHRIKAYADRCGVKIYNATPDSFIDAFPRRSLSAAATETTAENNDV